MRHVAGTLILTLSALTLPTPALAYKICKVEGPAQKPESCLIHFDEGSVELSAAAVREIEICMEKLNWARELELVGHADACPMDTRTAVKVTGTKVLTSLDTGNSLLAGERVDRVSGIISQTRSAKGKTGGALLYTSNESDSHSTRHDSDDRSVEIRARQQGGGCQWHFVFDGSGSMEGSWSSIANVRYPVGACFHIVVGDGQYCPTSLSGYRPYGATYIYTAVSEQFVGNSTNQGSIVVLSDFDQKDARSQDIQKVNDAVKRGAIKVWMPPR